MVNYNVLSRITTFPLQLIFTKYGQKINEDMNNYQDLTFSRFISTFFDSRIRTITPSARKNKKFKTKLTSIMNSQRTRIGN